jgi:selenophosphate synthetase-related protein
VLVGGVVNDQLGNHAKPPAMRLAQKFSEIFQSAIIAMDVVVIGDIVSIIFEGGRIKRQEPYCGYTEIFKIVQFLRQTFEVSHAVIVAIEVGLDVKLVDDGVLVPQGVVAPFT